MVFFFFSPWPNLVAYTIDNQFIVIAYTIIIPFSRMGSLFSLHWQMGLFPIGPTVEETTVSNIPTIITMPIQLFIAGANSRDSSDFNKGKYRTVKTASVNNTYLITRMRVYLCVSHSLIPSLFFSSSPQWSSVNVPALARERSSR